MELPGRPTVVTVAAALLLGSAGILALSWIVWPASVISNGGQVFFIMLWTVLAHAAFTGLGWVRLAIAAIFAASVWGVINTSIAAAFADVGFTDAVGAALQVSALTLLCLPAANQWFAEVAELAKDE